MFIAMALIWILVVGAILFVVHHFNHSHGDHDHWSPPRSSSSPIDVLKMRFARGEMDEEEFTRRMKILREDQ